MTTSAELENEISQKIDDYRDTEDTLVDELSSITYILEMDVDIDSLGGDWEDVAETMSRNQQFLRDAVSDIEALISEMEDAEALALEIHEDEQELEILYDTEEAEL